MNINIASGGSSEPAGRHDDDSSQQYTEIGGQK